MIRQRLRWKMSARSAGRSAHSRISWQIALSPLFLAFLVVVLLSSLASASALEAKTSSGVVWKAGAKWLVDAMLMSGTSQILTLEQQLCWLCL